MLVFLIVVCGSLFYAAKENPLPESVPGLAASLEYQLEAEQDAVVDREVIMSDKHYAESIDKVPATAGERKPRDVVVNIEKETRAAVKSLIDQTATPTYGFYDQLKSSQWSAPTQNGAYVDGNASRRAKAKYKLQAASFRHREDANRLANKLAKYRLLAKVNSSISTNGLEWHQVSVGPFSNVSKLNKAQDILVSLNMMPLKKKI